MAINKNHEFEELNGIKCGIVEKYASAERVAFLQALLEYNGYTVVVVPSPPPKAPPVKPIAGDSPGEAVSNEAAAPAPPDSFTVGVTDYTFNPINAIFGRTLRTQQGGLVTQAYWYQQEKNGRDNVPYYERTPVR